MLKLLLVFVIFVGLPVLAISQETHLSCTPPGSPGGQFIAISRIGIGTSYTLTAAIKSVSIKKGVKSSSGTTTSFQARDDQGRTRVDLPTFCAIDQNGQRHWNGTISINDPVGNTFTSYQVNSYSDLKIATVKSDSLPHVDPPTAQSAYASAQVSSQASDHDADNSHMRFKVEDLGKRTIVGLKASGMRVTRTYPAGSLSNTVAAEHVNVSMPITEVEETWTSDQYRMILLDIRENDVLGSSSYEVTKFTFGEPDASLFQQPAGYTIQTSNQEYK